MIIKSRNKIGGTIVWRNETSKGKSKFKSSQGILQLQSWQGSWKEWLQVLRKRKFKWRNKEIISHLEKLTLRIRWATLVNSSEWLLKSKFLPISCPHLLRRRIRRSESSRGSSYMHRKMKVTLWREFSKATKARKMRLRWNMNKEGSKSFIKI